MKLGGRAANIRELRVLAATMKASTISCMICVATMLFTGYAYHQHYIMCSNIATLMLKKGSSYKVFGYIEYLIQLDARFDLVLGHVGSRKGLRISSTARK